MTLLLALSSPAFATVLADRRLTANGRICEDESNKLCILFCDDARAVIAYTGVAAWGPFRTQDWMRETLWEIGKTKHTLDEILNQFRLRANRRFSNLPGPVQPIAFLVSGMSYCDQPKNVCYLLSNFQRDARGLQIRSELELRKVDDERGVIVMAEGYIDPVKKTHLKSLRRMLEAGNAPQHVLRKAVGIIQAISKSPLSRRMIGTQCNSGVVPAKPDTQITSTYHSVAPKFRAFGPDIVFAVNGCGGEVTGMFLEAEMILAGPEIRKNEPCWCESGKLFGSCHFKKFGSVYARLPCFSKPLQMVVAFWKKQPEKSGRVYSVGSSFV